ncbi:hypothetical protein [Mesomycoplasma ovipneumoniae]|uniref:hypothetical protein n=1 Tax=Mesomycoplasma ovipneumoniae TaxID=29562 RepID=UPI0028B05535|nr:hypothetical protein [Mesomycoplasma ovipneumoniae]WNM15345.1 hypothetical protein RNM01_01810 [Mesomycoplasma ovipneumoniae]
MKNFFVTNPWYNNLTYSIAIFIIALIFGDILGPILVSVRYLIWRGFWIILGASVIAGLVAGGIFLYNYIVSSPAEEQKEKGEVLDNKQNKKTDLNINVVSKEK